MTDQRLNQAVARDDGGGLGNARKRLQIQSTILPSVSECKRVRIGGGSGGRGPNQNLLQEQGNAYLEKSFPKLDYVKRVTIR